MKTLIKYTQNTLSILMIILLITIFSGCSDEPSSVELLGKECSFIDERVDVIKRDMWDKAIVTIVREDTSIVEVDKRALYDCINKGEDK